MPTPMAEVLGFCLISAMNRVMKLTAGCIWHLDSHVLISNIFFSYRAVPVHTHFA